MALAGDASPSSSTAAHSLSATTSSVPTDPTPAPSSAHWSAPPTEEELKENQEILKILETQDLDEFFNLDDFDL